MSLAEKWKWELKSERFKYFVIKMDDLFDACNESLIYDFNEILKTYNEYREKQDKPINNYWIVNRDEPYADKIKKLIEKNEGVKL